MKKLLLTSLFPVLYACLLTAQVNIPTGSVQEVNTFFNGKTYIVLENRLMSDYNDMMKAVTANIWSVTPVEFITLKEFESKRKEKNVSFLMINQVYFDADKSNTFFDFLVLIAGGNYPSVNEMPLLCGVPLCYEGEEEETWVPKIPLATRFIQSHMILSKNHPEMNSKNAVEYYISHHAPLSSKILYIPKEQLEVALQSKSAFSAIYPFPFEICETSKTDELISMADSSALILHIISPVDNDQTDKCIKFIINPGTAEIYYYDMHDISANKPPCLLESDIKKLAKQQ